MEPVKSAPERRVLLLHGSSKTIVLEQKVEDHWPRGSTVRIGSRKLTVPDGSRIFEAGQMLGEPLVSCTVRFMPDVEISFHPGKTEAPVIRDAKLNESVPAGREMEGLENMDTTTLWIMLDALYQESSQFFSDPYQYIDTREQKLHFTSGSEQGLTAGITWLLHAFPKLYQRALASEDRLNKPTIEIYSAYDHKRPGFNIELWNPDVLWRCVPEFQDLLYGVVEKNTPTGFRFRNPKNWPCLVRRSRFIKDAIPIPICPDVPSDDQIEVARERLARMELIDTSLFYTMPIQPA
jgi:hypothetical protein